MYSDGAASLGWLLNNFTQQTAGVREALAVSSDGILLAASDGLADDSADQLGAIVSGLASLTTGGAACLGQPHVNQVIVEMADAYLFVTMLGQGAQLGVVARGDCEIGLVAYEMTLVVARIGEILTPELITELKNLLTA